jgi:hypothetical protein
MTLGMKQNPWVRLLTYITGLVNQERLLQNEYLAAENRISRVQLSARLRLSDLDRTTLAKIGKRLGRKALAQVACVAQPDSILACVLHDRDTKLCASAYAERWGDL